MDWSLAIMVSIYGTVLYLFGFWRGKRFESKKLISQWSCDRCLFVVKTSSESMLATLVRSHLDMHSAQFAKALANNPPFVEPTTDFETPTKTGEENG